MSDVTLDKKTYKEVIKEDIELVEKYIPKEHILRTHILAVLNWSIDKQYPPEYWDKIPCPDCKGEGYSFFVDQGEPDPGSKCARCNGKGRILPEPPKGEGICKCCGKKMKNKTEPEYICMNPYCDNYIKIVKNETI
jgi:DnaJ-class molecular chaperone